MGASGTKAAAATTSIWQHHVLDGYNLQDDTLWLFFIFHLCGYQCWLLCCSGVYHPIWVCYQYYWSTSTDSIWNPQWKPHIFMTDCSEAEEISALESCFPSATVYLWFSLGASLERWMKDHKHGLNLSEGEWLLNQLRVCAWAQSAHPDKGLPPDHHFQEAVKVLQSS